MALCVVATSHVALFVIVQKLLVSHITHSLNFVDSADLVAELYTCVWQGLLIIGEFGIARDRDLLDGRLSDFVTQMASFIISDGHFFKAPQVHSHKHVFISWFLLAQRDVTFLRHISAKVALRTENESSWMKLRRVEFRAVLPTRLLIEANVVVLLQVALHTWSTDRYITIFIDISLPALLQQANVVIDSVAEPALASTTREWCAGPPHLLRVGWHACTHSCAIVVVDIRFSGIH